jgi:hypothetical protein
VSHPDEAALRAALDGNQDIWLIVAELNDIDSTFGPRLFDLVMETVRPYLRPVVTEAQVREALGRHGWYIPPGLLFGPYADVVAALRDLGVIGGEE